MEDLKKAICELMTCNIEDAESYTREVFRQLLKADKEGKQLIFPVVLEQDVINRFGKTDITTEDLEKHGRNFSFSPCTLTSNTGETVFAAFTDYEAVNCGEAVCTITTDIDLLMENVLKEKDIAGLFINPFSTPCFLSRELIAELFIMDYEQDKIHCEKPAEVFLNSSEAVEEAIVFATQCHKGTFRKGTDVPYIAHPMEAAQILVSVHADYNLIIAALLHDTVEDTGLSIDIIREKYGDDVAWLVDCHSENKSKVWYARKLKTIKDLPQEDIRAKLLTLADKLSNIRSMYRDYKLVGEELWSRFNAPKHLQSWYYGGIVDGLAELQDIAATADAYNELCRLYKELFVDYYINRDAGILYQFSAHGEGYVLYKGNPQWQPLTESFSESTQPATRRYAERKEEEWNEPFWAVHTSDMADGSYTIYNRNGKTTHMVMEKECLSYTGNDFGFAMDEFNSNRFLSQLRISLGIEDSLEKVLKKAFGSAKGVQKFIDFCCQTATEFTEVNL